MIEKLSKNMQKEGRFRKVAYFGSKSGSYVLKWLFQKFLERLDIALNAYIMMSLMDALADKLMDARNSTADRIHSESLICFWDFYI